MAWAKVHTDMFSDPKLMRAARKGHGGLDQLPWLIIFAKLADDDGRLSIGGLPATAEDIADGVPGKPVDAVGQCMASAQAIGVLERDADEVLRFRAWHPRQDKPSASKEAVRERVKRHRNRQRNARSADAVTPSNAHVTRTCNATEKRNPTGFLVTRGGSGAPALADAARDTESVDLVEPTPEERARAQAFAAELRAAGDSA